MFFLVIFLYNIFYTLLNMNPTHENSGDKLLIDRESFLCKLLESGGKCLDNEEFAFQKKYFCCLKE